jgi:DNA-binding transcriptional ArsR family regulator
MTVKKKINIIKAIGNENRARLILCLTKPQSVTELLGRCSLSQSALSQHLKILKDCKVATCEKVGKQQIYVVEDKQILKLAAMLLTIN